MLRLDGTLFVGFGAPNAGKGTALKALMNFLAPVTFAYLSTGDLVRDTLQTVRRASRGEEIIHDPFLLSLVEKLERTESGDLFSDADFEALLLRGVVQSFSGSNAVKAGDPYLLDGGVRKEFQFDVVRRTFTPFGYKRFVLLNFRMPRVSEWNKRRNKRLTEEARADDRFEAACKKLVLHLLSEEEVLPACEPHGFELININAQQSPEQVLTELALAVRR